MKMNLHYIFDKITRHADNDAWQGLTRDEIIGMAIDIGESDRGISIGIEKAGLVADAILGLRTANHSDAALLRAGLCIDQ
ncbi:MAG: hypothetical protein ACI83P_001245 [Janthinobacterium sp.]|jgi:hypothetical protein